MNAEQQAYLWKRVKKIKVGMMTSRDGDKLRSRPMYITQEEFSGIFYFFTRTDAHKTAEINIQDDVNISFMDVDDDEYVSVSGTARLSNNREKLAELWTPMVAAWFPEGRDSGAVGLLEVHVKSAEVWDAQEGKMKQMLELLSAKAKQQKPNLGSNRKLS